MESKSASNCNISHSQASSIPAVSQSETPHDHEYTKSAGRKERRAIRNVTDMLTNGTKMIKLPNKKSSNPEERLIKVQLDFNINDSSPKPAPLTDRNSNSVNETKDGMPVARETIASLNINTGVDSENIPTLLSSAYSSFFNPCIVWESKKKKAVLSRGSNAFSLFLAILIFLCCH
jgi:hypothetical protein